MTNELRCKALIVITGAVLLMTGCSRRTEPVKRETTAMDTFLSVTIYDQDKDETSIHALIDSVFSEVRRIEQMATDYSPDSEIGRANALAGADTVAVSIEIRDILEAAVRHSRLSHGAFDVTVGPAVHLWDFLSDSPAIPDSQAVERLLRLVDYRKVSLMPSGLYLEDAGMQIDLGGIAKGYAVDRAIRILIRNGIRNVIIDLGGNLGVFWEGTSFLDSTRATISVRHPRNPEVMIVRFDVGTSGIATSGDYQRFFIADGIRYHHVLDPKTGFPARGVVSVTIIASDALTADALSTSVFVLGREEGFDLIESLDRVEGIILFEEGDSLGMEVSSGLRGKVIREESRD